MWKQIISAALSDKPREVDYAFRREMLRPARSRYGSTRPAVLNWFKRYNEGRAYAEQVKPFNFLLTFFTRRQEDVTTEDPTHEWDPKLEDMRPVAPYENDIDKALRRVFDRNSDSMEPCRGNGFAPSLTCCGTTIANPNTSFSAAAGTRKACCVGVTSLSTPLRTSARRVTVGRRMRREPRTGHGADLSVILV